MGIERDNIKTIFVKRKKKIDGDIRGICWNREEAIKRDKRKFIWIEREIVQDRWR